MTSNASAVGTAASTTLRQLQSSPAASNRPAVESAVQEATETPAVTRKEAQHGDRVAQRKLAKEEAAQAAIAGGASRATATPTTNEPSSREAPTGHRVNTHA